jgi:hypothetical protein
MAGRISGDRHQWRDRGKAVLGPRERIGSDGAHRSAGCLYENPYAAKRPTRRSSKCWVFDSGCMPAANRISRPFELLAHCQDLFRKVPVRRQAEPGPIGSDASSSGVKSVRPSDQASQHIMAVGKRSGWAARDFAPNPQTGVAGHRLLLAWAATAQWAMALGHACVDFKGALDDSARRSGRGPAQRRDRAPRQRLKRPTLLKENKDVRCHQDWRQAVSRDG